MHMFRCVKVLRRTREVETRSEGITCRDLLHNLLKFSPSCTRDHSRIECNLTLDIVSITMENPLSQSRGKPRKYR